MQTIINNTKMNSDMTTTEPTTAPAQTLPAPRRPRPVLKMATVMLSLVALCLSYRAAGEAIALYGVLEKVQDALAHEQMVKSQAAPVVPRAEIAETKSGTAGL